MIVLTIKNRINKSIDFFKSTPELMITTHIILPIFIVYLGRILVNVEINALFEMITIISYILYALINSKKNEIYLIHKINNNKNINIIVRSMLFFTLIIAIVFLIKGNDLYSISKKLLLYTYLKTLIYAYILHRLYVGNYIGNKQDVVMLKTLFVSLIAFVNFDNVVYVLIFIIIASVVYRFRKIKNYLLYAPYNISLGLIIGVLILSLMFSEKIRLPQNLLVVVIFLIINTYALEAFNCIEAKTNDYYQKINILYLNYLVGVLLIIFVTMIYQYDIWISITIYTFLYNLLIVIALYFDLDNLHYSLMTAIPTIVFMFIEVINIQVIIMLNITSLLLFLLIIDIDIKALVKQVLKMSVQYYIIYAGINFLQLDALMTPIFVLVSSGHIHELIHAIAFRMTGNYTKYTIKFGLLKNKFICMKNIKNKKTIYVLPSLILVIIGLIWGLYDKYLGLLLVLQVFNLLPIEGLDGYYVFGKGR